MYKSVLNEAKKNYSVAEIMKIVKLRFLGK